MSDNKKPLLHTEEQEKQVLGMINPVLDVIQAEFGAWGIDCVRDFCRGRIEEISTQTHRT